MLDYTVLYSTLQPEYLATICILPLLTITLVIFWSVHKRSISNDLPGLGTLHCFRRRNEFPEGKQHLAITRLGKQYDGIFRFANLIIVDKKEIAQDIYIGKDPTFTGRPEMDDCFGYESSFGAQDLFYRSYGPEWKFLRKQGFKVLHAYGSGLQKFELIVREELLDLTMHLEATNRKDTDPAPLIYAAVINIIATLIFGQKYNYDSVEVKLMHELDVSFLAVCSPVIPELVLNPWSRWLLRIPLQRYQKKRHAEQECLRLRDRFCDEIVNKYKEEFDCHNVHSALGHLLAAQQEHGTDVFSDHMLLGIIVDIIITGIATTRSATTGLIFSLISNPVVQARARKEIFDVIGDSRPPCIKDKDKLPYVSAVILEQLRFQSIAPMGTYRTAMHDIKIGDYSIKKGENVLVNQWALHHDPQQWEKPEEFYPQHFLDEHGQLLTPDVYKSKGYVPFGAGRRACLGESLAKTRLFIIAATLLQRFEMLPPENGAMPRCHASAFQEKCTMQAPPYNARFIPLQR